MEPAAKEPTTLIIFGATGDLARRKLLPALFHLFSNGYLPEKCAIVGLARQPFSQQEFQEFAATQINQKLPAHRPEEMEEFQQLLHFASGDFQQPDVYKKLGKELHQLDEEIFSTCSNKLFYLAVPPRTYGTMFEHLAESGLTIPCGGDEGWTRVLVEKPFGKDLATAQTLDKKLGTLFQEEQIFRIDHYLAKETVQNIISFRFANAIFEPIWDHEDIQQVDITVWETLGIGERASFYEDVGALRDVGQNHMLQLLALIAMEDPKELDPQAIRTTRAKVLQQLRPLENIDTQTVRGQYAGYQAEAPELTDSHTETYFKITAFIDNDRWRNVPFYLESGKKLAENKVEIKITLKEPISCVCPVDDQQHQNVLTIRIQPDEGISLKFWVKKPGLDMELEPRVLSFFYKDSEVEQSIPDAYEKVLYDCIRGDQTLFASTDEVTAAWEFITPILESWQDQPLRTYEPGSEGPK